MFGRSKQSSEPGELLVLIQSTLLPPVPPTTPEEAARAAEVIKHFKAGASHCTYASFDEVADRPGGKVIFVWAKDGISLAMGVAREVATRLSEESQGLYLLDDPQNLPHKVWVPTQ